MLFIFVCELFLLALYVFSFRLFLLALYASIYKNIDYPFSFMSYFSLDACSSFINTCFFFKYNSNSLNTFVNCLQYYNPKFSLSI